MDQSGGGFLVFASYVGLRCAKFYILKTTLNLTEDLFF